MEEALLSLINGVPIAAAVLYVWIVSEKNNREEIKAWRETVKQKDAYLEDVKDSLAKLTTEISKLTLIFDNYVIRNRKNPTGE